MQFCVSVAGAASVSLVVETEFSGGARCVWVDPALLLAPLPPDVEQSLLGVVAANGVALVRA